MSSFEHDRKIPASITAIKKRSIDAEASIIAAQIVVKPAAGPLTLSEDLLITGTIMPPIIPAINPAYKGAPQPNDMPRHSGNATKKTVILDFKSCRRKENTYVLILRRYICIMKPQR